MVAGTPCQRELGTLEWRRIEKGDKQVECTRLGGRDMEEVRHLEPGGIRDWTVFGICSPNIPVYYKRNRHFQCCIETKLLMI